MRAVVVEEFGGPGVLRVRDVGKPGAGSGQVRVAVHASGVNPVEAGNRADGSWAGILPPFVPGYEASGIVDEVGPGVEGFSPGDEVFYMADFLGNAHGTHAEYHVADAAVVARKPGGLSHVEAAALPLAGATAHETVACRLAVERGEWLLVHGAAGGVGSLAVQMAVARGARVVASASAGHHAFLYGLGVAACVDYSERDVPEAAREAAGGELDAVADFVGGEALARSLPALRTRGRAATVASLAGDLEPAIDKNLTLHGVLVRPDRAPLEAMSALVEAGALRPVVDEVLPLEGVVGAHRRLETGHGRGKVVLRVR